MSTLTLSGAFAVYGGAFCISSKFALLVYAHSISVEVVPIEQRYVMNAILLLLAASAVVGLVLGFYFRWLAILISGLILASFAATVLQDEGFSFLAGIAIIVV